VPWLLLAALPVLARAVLPGRQVLRQASAKLLGARSLAVDLDEAGHRVDLFMDGGGTGGAERRLADLLGESIESITHAPPEGATSVQIGQEGQPANEGEISSSPCARVRSLRGTRDHDMEPRSAPA
jgi:hypothetical protein